MAVAFDAVASATGFGSGSSPLSFTHTAGAGGGTVLVLATIDGSTTGVAATYGGTAMTLLGSRASNNIATDGIVYLFGITGAASGANTVSVSTGTGFTRILGNAVSFTGAGSFGTAVTGSGAATPATVTAGSTTAGNMVFGGGGSGATGTTTFTSGTSRFVLGDNNGNGVGNIFGGTIAAGGSVSVTVTIPTDVWGMVGVEVQAGGGAAAGPGPFPARPGKTWLRRFHHPQFLPPAPAVTAAAVTAPAPLMRPAVASRPPARARVGPYGRGGGGIAGPQPAAPVASRPFIARSAPPRRARTGPAGLSGAGVASAVVTPLGVPSRPRPFVFRSPAPARARTGPAGRPGSGLGSSVVTPLGSMPRPMPRPVIQHLPPSRGQAGPLGLAGAGLASGIVTPRGTPGPSWRPQPRRPGPERALWHGNAGPPAVAPAAPQAYQHPPGQARRPAPARAVWHGQAGPANAAPVTNAPPRPPVQPRSRPPQRAVWHGNASRTVTPLGTPARRPGPVITSKPRSRGLWHGNTGPVPVASAPPPRWKPLPARRRPQRGTWQHVAGTANLPPPAPPTFGTAADGTSTVPRALAGTATLPYAAPVPPPRKRSTTRRSRPSWTSPVRCWPTRSHPPRPSPAQDPHPAPRTRSSRQHAHSKAPIPDGQHHRTRLRLESPEETRPVETTRRRRPGLVSRSCLPQAQPLDRARHAVASGPYA